MLEVQGNRFRQLVLGDVARVHDLGDAVAEHQILRIRHMEPAAEFCSRHLSIEVVVENHSTETVQLGWQAGLDLASVHDDILRHLRPFQKGIFAAGRG